MFVATFVTAPQGSRGGSMKTIPELGVSMALEVSKFYMDEWTGQPHFKLLHGITEALRSTVMPVERALRSLTI